MGCIYPGAESSVKKTELDKRRKTRIRNNIRGGMRTARPRSIRVGYSGLNSEGKLVAWYAIIALVMIIVIVVMGVTIS